MTWAFLARYCDELYSIVDNRDRFVKKFSCKCGKAGTVFVPIKVIC
jgi:hypothetical protein